MVFNFIIDKLFNGFENKFQHILTNQNKSCLFICCCFVKTIGVVKTIVRMKFGSGEQQITCSQHVFTNSESKIHDFFSRKTSFKGAAKYLCRKN